MSKPPEFSSEANLLQALASREYPSQRKIAQDLGVALGLTNSLLKRLVSQGYVQVSHARPRHFRYLVTSEGQRALADMSRVSLQNTVRLYTDTRDRIRWRLDHLVAMQQARRPGPTGVVFYGAGDVAEITYVSLQSTSIYLTGVVDDEKRGQFFGHTVECPRTLTIFGGPSYEAPIVVTSFEHADAIQRRCASMGIPPERLFFLDAVTPTLQESCNV